MKTLEEIKNEIAQGIGYESADNYLSELYEIGSIYTLERITLFINEIATRTAKEALNNASENAILVNKFGNDIGSFAFDENYNKIWINKQSILNESNIQKL